MPIHAIIAVEVAVTAWLPADVLPNKSAINRIAYTDLESALGSFMVHGP
jgi:hypothetical protein